MSEHGQPPYRLPGSKGYPGCVVMFLPALAAVGLAYLVRWVL